MLFKALLMAHTWHRGQVRKYSGTPYVHHPIRVMAEVAKRCDSTEDMLIAALLHDVMEDCGVEKDELKVMFGEGVASLVGQLTNPSKGSPLSRPERKAMDREHIERASIPAQVIKMIDRIDNLREFDAADAKFKEIYCRESRMLRSAIWRADPKLGDELLQAIEDLEAK